MTDNAMASGENIPIQDRNNIINQRDGESLYQICHRLRRRLSGVPGFRPYLDEMEEEAGNSMPDPVSSLWRCFRTGQSLIVIYNASEPAEGDLRVDYSRVAERQAAKIATYQFIQASKNRWSIPDQDSFILQDLYGDNTTGFVKVAKMVNRVLDQLENSGKLQFSGNMTMARNGLPNATNGRVVQLTRRQHIIKELVDTERQYVHHLNNLQELKKDLEQTGALTGDTIHAIFLNLTNLVDFAQRFGIRVEQHSELPEEDQNWGSLFIKYKDAFYQYIPFISNTIRCEDTCQREWDKMRSAACTPLMEQMLANPQTLNGFLIKPFQRLTKYPLLLKDLSKQLDVPPLIADLQQAIKNVEETLDQANAAIDKEQRKMAFAEVSERVEDWRSLKIGTFGDLILFGTFTIQKGDSGKDSEREYHLYLFEAILLCCKGCKDPNQNKQKKLMGGNKEKSSLTAKGKPKLMLKGRIFLANITDIATFQRQGNYAIQIFWKGDAGVENFVIKYKNEDTLKKWDHTIETLRGSMNKTLRSRSTGTSDTQFTYMQGVKIENPHQEYDDDEDEREVLTNGNAQSEFNMSRNASSTSLRSRSATNGSGNSSSTYTSSRPPRFPMPDPGSLPPLNTAILHNQPSPSDPAGQSYFSPVTERDTSTPISASARSSSQSAFASYNRYGTPVNGGWSQPEENNRNTAPAMSRNMSRDPSNGNPYLVNGRGQRPSLPPSSNSRDNSSRMRSASSPDIHQNLPPNRRYPNGQPMPNGEHVPTVPPIPSHVAGRVAPVNRNQSGSPTNGVPLSIRTASPAAPPQYGLPPRPGLASYHTDATGMYQQRTYPRDDPRMDPRSIMTINTPSTIASDRTFSPPLPTSSSISTSSTFVENDEMPSQLKAKVLFDDNYITLIVPRNIQFRSLTDRIDAKLGRLTSQSIGSNTLRLRYRDEDGDYIWIDSDEAVQEAFLDWRERNANKLSAGTSEEIVLYCHSVNGEPIATG
ncbi:MAG: hypothetical protein Q9227_000989 [Pyrenula ochraceoflavens]